jgi:H+-translocating NAD(P) transhydrogenase subunit alpha
MRVSIPTETAPLERRVALTPDGVSRLRKSGIEVVVQRGAGVSAGFVDEAYEQAGAVLAVDAAAAHAGADIVARVQPPSTAEAALVPQGKVLVSLLQPSRNEAVIAQLRDRGVTALALELVPRTTRAQSMDVLSSQATVAGYKAVLLGAASMPRFLPMLTTAAGNISPSKVFVLGAGVAGLQAIATARRLGGVVSAFDVRPAAAEQIRSLGATVVAEELIAATAEGGGGYARAQTDEERARTQAAIAEHLRTMDLVLTTAQVPGRPAPRLITAEMVRGMRPGAVIVDLAAESGGNCEVTRAGEQVDIGGVSVLGPTDLASTVPYHASFMFARNITALLGVLVKDGAVTLDDEIVRAMIVTGSSGS